MPSRHEAVRRVDDPPVPFPTLLSRPRPYHRLYSEQPRGAISGPLRGLEYPDDCYLIDIGPSSFLVGLVPGSPHQPSSQTSPDRSAAYWSSVVRPPAKRRRRFADGRLKAIALCVLESLDVRHEVVGALLALEANDS